MIYYTNASLTTAHMAFIGRWSPFHQGHIALINKKRLEHPKIPILIMVRNTGTDMYSAATRAEYIKSWMTQEGIQGTLMIVPNIEGVYWGRGVGYHVEQIDVDLATLAISGTAIRKEILSDSKAWKSRIANKKSSYILSPAISHIVDRGLVLWLTGCPSSGKTTIAKAVMSKLNTTYPHLKTQVLDGDNMRSSPLASGVGFSKIDRNDHIRRMAYLAKMFADHGICVICAFVSPYRNVRQEAKKIIGKNRFIEIYVKASLKTRVRRDAKGLYKQAASGKLKQFTGYNAPYEVPKQPAITCDTDKQSVDESVHSIMQYVLGGQNNRSLK